MRQSGITVVMPNHNHGKYLHMSLFALTEQAYQPDEIIVVDDGSTDDSIEILNNFSSQVRKIRLVRLTENRGSIEAIAEGQKLVNTEYVYFAAADDVTFTNFFADAVQLLDEHPEAAFCNGLAVEMDTHGENMRLIECPNVRTISGSITPSLADENIINLGGWFRGNTTIYRTRFLRKEGGFDPALGPFTDAYMCMNLALKYGACFINKPLGAIRASSDNFSTKTSFDIDALINICMRAERKMYSEGDEIFSNVLIHRWKRRWMFTMLYNNRKNLALDDLVAIDRKMNTNVFEGEIFRFFWRLAHKNDLLMRLFFLLWLTPWDVGSSFKYRMQKTISLSV